MDPLTPHQRQVAVLAADGYTIKEIAQKLGANPRTTKAHLDNVRRKLGVEKKREIGRALRALEATA